jgi:hypothetical protein
MIYLNERAKEARGEYNGNGKYHARGCDFYLADSYVCDYHFQFQDKKEKENRS